MYDDSRAVYDSAWRTLCFEHHENDDPVKIDACSDMMKLADSDYPPALFYAISHRKELLLDPVPHLNRLLSIEDDSSGEAYFYTTFSYLSLSDAERYREYSIKALECGYIHEYYEYRFDAKQYLDRLDPSNYNTLQKFTAFQSYRPVSVDNKWADALISALESDLENDILHPRCLVFFNIFDLDRSESVHLLIQKTLEKAAILELSREELNDRLMLCPADQKETAAKLAFTQLFSLPI